MAMPPHAAWLSSKKTLLSLGLSKTLDQNGRNELVTSR